MKFLFFVEHFPRSFLYEMKLNSSSLLIDTDFGTSYEIIIQSNNQNSIIYHPQFISRTLDIIVPTRNLNT